jgi:hypothetical protein
MSNLNDTPTRQSGPFLSLCERLLIGAMVLLVVGVMYLAYVIDGFNTPRLVLNENKLMSQELTKKLQNGEMDKIASRDDKLTEMQQININCFLRHCTLTFLTDDNQTKSFRTYYDVFSPFSEITLVKHQDDHSIKAYTNGRETHTAYTPETVSNFLDGLHAVLMSIPKEVDIAETEKTWQVKN